MRRRALHQLPVKLAGVIYLAGPYSIRENKAPEIPNIWANEQRNKIHRYRKTEEMRGMLKKQKEEKKARDDLKRNNISKLEMKYYREGIL